MHRSLFFQCTWAWIAELASKTGGPFSTSRGLLCSGVQIIVHIQCQHLDLESRCSMAVLHCADARGRCTVSPMHTNGIVYIVPVEYLYRPVAFVWVMWSVHYTWPLLVLVPTLGLANLDTRDDYSIPPQWGTESTTIESAGKRASHCANVSSKCCHSSALFAVPHYRRKRGVLLQGLAVSN